MPKNAIFGGFSENAGSGVIFDAKVPGFWGFCQKWQKMAFFGIFWDSLQRENLEKGGQKVSFLGFSEFREISKIPKIPKNGKKWHFWGSKMSLFWGVPKTSKMAIFAKPRAVLLCEYRHADMVAFYFGHFGINQSLIRGPRGHFWGFPGPPFRDPPKSHF